jgi:hypothetical protein
MYLFGEIAMLNSTETCGKVTEEIIIKGHHSFKISFFKDAEKKSGKVSSRAFKIKELEELKKYDCIKIKYSNSFPSYIEIVDKRLRAGSGW